MTARNRPAVLLAVAGLLLGPVACGHAEDPGPARTGSTDTPRDVNSGPAATTDPDVTVTPDPDPPRSAPQHRTGRDAADSTHGAVELIVPAIGLRTPVTPQGLRGGRINPDPGEVIWYTGHDRVRPGATGTAVVAGHVVTGGRPDAFAALEDLEVGDELVLDHSDGERLRLEITSTRIVAKDALTTNRQVWGPNRDTRRVVLVTCDDELGFRTDGHRRANFVAVAELPS